MSANEFNSSAPFRVDTSEQILSTVALIDSDSALLMDEPTDMEFPVLLKSLPVPERFAADTDRVRRNARGLRKLGDKIRFEEDLRLRMYFGGMHVVCLQTPQGRCVVAAGCPGTGVLSEAIARMKPEDAQRLDLESPWPWEDLIEANAVSEKDPHSA